MRASLTHTATPVLTLAEIAKIVEGRLQGEGNLLVHGVAQPDQAATDGQLVLVLDQQGSRALTPSNASCALVATNLDIPPGLWHGWITVDQPRHALARLLPLFWLPPRLAPGIHVSAVVEPSARIAADASIGPLCYVGEDVVVGSGARVLAHCTLGADSHIGEGSLLHPGVRIGERVSIGHRVIIHANACIGADGFSFVTDRDQVKDAAPGGKPAEDNAWEPAKIPSLGGVIIEDDVEIGACTTIDRATLGNTLIRRGTKIDNLVMVGHNSRIGECCVIAGQSGIAGSCELEDRVVMGGQSGIADHLRIGSHAVIAASAGVGQHVPKHSVYINNPAIPYDRFQERWRSIGRLKRLFAEFDRVKLRLLRLERGVAASPSDESQ
jgi:UDP-3-O-[3-hydroxymyristoyl] glucosamine N-acyltransferase